jgi:arsenite methyltransferase
MNGSAPDKWHRWLLGTRDGEDPDRRARVLAERLYPVRDQMLAAARLAPGEVLLDVGTGDGLIAFGALDIVGETGRVIFSDISQDLLDHCRLVAEAEGVAQRCEFVRAAADDLSAIAGECTDVVTTRAVLIYVADKPAALQEFYRVLRPGGRVVLHEPINRLHCAAGLFWGYDLGQIPHIQAKLDAFFDGVQPPDTDPMLDFDDRDLVRFAEQAGFPDVRLSLRVEVSATTEPCPWEVFLHSAPNPLVPPFGEVMGQVLDDQEAVELTRAMRPLVESGTGQHRLALAELTAVKGQ